MKQVDSSNVDVPKTSIGQVLFSGISFRPKSNRSIYIPSVSELIQFNTVEGIVFNPSVSYTKYLSGNRFYQISPTLRHGFGNGAFQGELKLNLLYNAENFASIIISGGKIVNQLNANSNLGAFSNSYNTLLSNQNFLKLFERNYFKFEHTLSPLKHLLLTNRLQWENRKPLQNLIRFDEENSDFTSNAPDNIELPVTDFESHQAFKWQTQFKWQLGQRYRRHRGKFVSVSDQPAVTFTFTTTLPSDIVGDVNYQKFSLGLSDKYRFNAFGKGKYSIGTGGFFAKKNITFLDFKHFNGNQSVYNTFEINAYQLLDYYQYSTSGNYVEAHIQHQINALAIGRKALQINPVLSINYLHTDLVNHLEIGIGLEKILKYWRFDFYTAFQDNGFESAGIRFGYWVND